MGVHLMGVSHGRVSFAGHASHRPASYTGVYFIGRAC